MNPCHFCGQPATIHYTSIVAAEKVEQHLCEGCARERGVIAADATPAAPLNLQALVQLILGQHPPPAADAGSLKCPECGLKYAQFRADGRLGCPHDYDAFRDALLPLLERIHRDADHRGKAPRRAAGRADLADLRADLNRAIRDERYEDAAALRDRIRQKEGADEPR
jgi:protein arginine kinase activator